MIWEGNEERNGWSVERDVDREICLNKSRGDGVRGRSIVEGNEKDKCYIRQLLDEKNQSIGEVDG